MDIAELYTVAGFTIARHVTVALAQYPPPDPLHSADPQRRQKRRQNYHSTAKSGACGSARQEQTRFGSDRQVFDSFESYALLVEMTLQTGC